MQQSFSKTDGSNVNGMIFKICIKVLLTDKEMKKKHQLLEKGNTFFYGWGEIKIYSNFLEIKCRALQMACPAVVLGINHPSNSHSSQILVWIKWIYTDTHWPDNWCTTNHIIQQ